MRPHKLVVLGLLSSGGLFGAACGDSANDQSSGASTSSAGGFGGATSSATSSSSEATSSSSTSSASGVGGMDLNYPAPFPSPPQVAHGPGPVLLAPIFVPVFFAGDDSSTQSSLTSFYAGIGATAYWKATTSEYDVGVATSTAPVVLTEAAPATIDDTGIQTWLEGKLNGNDPLWPAATANTVYVINYPTGTAITLESNGGTEESCNQFGGYHSDLQFNAAHATMNVAYAVIPRCATFNGLSGIDAVSGAASHELIESSTDPYPAVNPAYSQTDDAHLYWDLTLGGGEAGDMCAQTPGVFTKFPGFDFTVQRSWSNKSVAAGHDPCVPELPGEVYFNSVPELNDSVTVQGAGVMKGVKIPLNTTKTIALDLYSDAATSGPWSVQVLDFGSLMGQAPTMKFSLAESSGSNGQKLDLSITPTVKGQFGLNIFVVISTLGATTNYWLGMVATA